jgi:hypothetical protein
MGDREVFIEHDQGHRRLVCLWGNDGFCACAGQRQMARAAVIETMEANGRRNSLASSKPVQAIYRHCSGSTSPYPSEYDVRYSQRVRLG